MRSLGLLGKMGDEGLRSAGSGMMFVIGLVRRICIPFGLYNEHSLNFDIDVQVPDYYKSAIETGRSINSDLAVDAEWMACGHDPETTMRIYFSLHLMSYDSAQKLLQSTDHSEPSARPR